MTRASLKPDRRVTLLFWAITLIGGGLWLLLLNFNLLERFEPTAQYILAAVLGAIGIGFFGAFLGRRDKWWRLIPGWLLLTLAAMVLLSTRTLPADAPDGRLIAAVLFWGLALAFLHVFLLRRALYWWAIIPSGFMLVLGGVVVASIYITRLETLGALLSMGMGLVFVMLYGAARAEQGWWPLIPATVLILFGVAAYTAESQIQNALLNFWPLLLILAGIFLGWQAARKPPAGPSMEIHSQQTGSGRIPPASPSRTAPASSTDARPNSQAADKSELENKRDTATAPDLEDDSENEGELGAYRGPAPGTSVDILDDDAPTRG
ncbi:MAG: hypothetical protein WDZ49_09730 [Litorilinea sp.]